METKADLSSYFRNSHSMLPLLVNGDFSDPMVATGPRSVISFRYYQAQAYSLGFGSLINIGSAGAWIISSGILGC